MADSKLALEKKYGYVLVVEYGDPISHEPLKTTFGIFPTQEEADEYRSHMFCEQNFICDILPLNDITEWGVRYAWRDSNIWIR